MCKKCSRKNFMIPNPTATGFNRPIRRTITPFVRDIQTTDQNRVYTFQPISSYKFQIVVDFPLQNYGDFGIKVVGENIHTEHLTDAIKFVNSNEAQFYIAFENSIPQEQYKPLEINDQNFQSFQKEPTAEPENKTA